MSHAVHHIFHSIGHFFHHAGHEIAHVWHKVEKPVLNIAGDALPLIPGVGEVGKIIGGGLSLLAHHESKPKVITYSPPQPQQKQIQKQPQRQLQPIGHSTTGVFQPQKTSFFQGGFGQELKNIGQNIQGWGHDLFGQVKGDVKTAEQKLGNFFSLL